jgi:peptidoglycan hydrolase CwlO-like protein
MTVVQETIAAVLIAVVIAASGFAAGYNRAKNHYAPLLDAANAELNTARREATALSASIASQNAALVQAKQQAEARAQAAQNAIAKAQAAAQQAEQSAQRILASRPPAGADECKAARGAFDAELAAERGVK